MLIIYYNYLPSLGQIWLMWKWVIDLAKQKYAQWRRAFARFTLIILPMNQLHLNLSIYPNPLPLHGFDSALPTKLLFHCNFWAWSNNPQNQRRFFHHFQGTGKKVKNSSFMQYFGKELNGKSLFSENCPYLLSAWLAWYILSGFVSCVRSYSYHTVAFVHSNMIPCRSVQLWSCSCLLH